MKFKLLVLFTFLIGCSLKAQITIPNGKAKLLEFNNETSNFMVPDGKSWMVYSVFSDCGVDGISKYDEYRKKNILENFLTIRVFLKTLNGEEKTNSQKNIFSTIFFNSGIGLSTIAYPIVFPSKTNFSFIILKGELGSLQLHNGKGYISLIEIEN